MERYLFWVILALLVVIGILVATNTNVVPILDDEGNVIGQSSCYFEECRVCLYSNVGTSQKTLTQLQGMPNCD